ncbi:hypothetical protein GC106_32950 [Kibdelosporangium sp. 4NS15]|uniref:HTH cro/C1-type domain-containing protein n=1 Tax=Kibdelosporangium persicum TaxID=2698649 RepID=A0ABX2F5A3_9PSEU|nr:helix-turn-helix transcriptional regulator [Kibdelosporangium persicum]NRN66077.1 hypothetical protein [Kibdelosporangium persicum]
MGERLATFRTAAGLTQAELAARVSCDRTTLTHLENGRPGGTVELWGALDTALAADGMLITSYMGLQALIKAEQHQQQQTRAVEAQARVAGLRQARSSGLTDELTMAASRAELTVDELADDELAAVELARRITASDVSDETLTRLETAFDDLATSYPKADPPALLGRLRLYLSYAAKLADHKATLSQKRRLVTVAGWLSLLAATVHIDLKQRHAATARLKTAAELAREAEHDEIRAWCYETEA